MTKSVKVVFTVSILLNVLFIGIFIGKGLDGGGHDNMREKRPWQKMKEELAPETRDIIKSTFKGAKKDVLPLFRDVRQKQEAMKDILTAPEFDGEAYDALVEEFRDINVKLVEGRMSAVKSIFSQLPQEEREKIAEHTVEKMMGKPPHHGRKGRDGRQQNDRQFNRERFERERMERERMERERHGAIDVERDRPMFDARRDREMDMNHPE